MAKRKLLVSALFFLSIFPTSAFHECVSDHLFSEESAVSKRYIDTQTVKAMCKFVYEHAIHAESPFHPELIIGLSRGGLIPLGFLAGDSMFNNRHVKTISVASYSDHGKQGKLLVLESWGHEDFEYLKRFNSILIVDDLVDSGRSLSFVLKMIQEHAPHATIKTAALFYKTCSIIKPDYYAQETTDWIVFPWEY